MRVSRAARATVVLAAAAALVFGIYEMAESPGSQLFGKTLVSGPKNQRVVALTYDDGPNPPYTDENLDVLRRERVHATFFVVGQAVQAYPTGRTARGTAAVTRSATIRGITATSCSTMSGGLRETLQRTDDAIYDATGCAHADYASALRRARLVGTRLRYAGLDTRPSCGRCR